VRFATAAALINEMVEAKHQLQLGRALARWARYDLIALDEVGYIPLAEVGAEFLFQVIAERAEKAAVIVHHQSAVLGMDPGDSQRPAL
jgi:DNA replication protein DnaC